jgi:hypothetical protein
MASRVLPQPVAVRTSPKQPHGKLEAESLDVVSSDSQKVDNGKWTSPTNVTGRNNSSNGLCP